MPATTGRWSTTSPSCRSTREILRAHDVEVFTDPEGRHMSHARALDLLVDRAEGAEFIVTLDTDAFPVSDGWLDQLDREPA